MHRTIEAVVEADGRVRRLEEVRVDAPRRALLTMSYEVEFASTLFRISGKAGGRSLRSRAMWSKCVWFMATFEGLPRRA
jgi:hypothetical protein